LGSIITTHCNNNKLYDENKKSKTDFGNLSLPDDLINDEQMNY